MKVYNLNNLPKSVDHKIKLSPKSKFILRNAHINVLDLLPKSYDEFLKSDRLNSEKAKKNFEEYQRKRLKKLEILISAREKLIMNDYLTIQNTQNQQKIKSHKENICANQQTLFNKNRQVSFFIFQNSAIKSSQIKTSKQRKSAQDYGFSSSHKKDRAQLLKPSQSKTSIFKKFKKNLRNGQYSHRIRSKEVIKHQKKKKLPKDLQTIFNETKLQQSRQIVKLIQDQKQKQQERKKQIQGMIGIQAKRLSKIHMIERFQNERKLDALKKKHQAILDSLLFKDRSS